MNKSNTDPLLHDLLTDSGYAEFRANLKQQSLGAFRRARTWRRVRAMGIAAVLAGASVAPFFWRPTQQSAIQTAALGTGPVPAEVRITKAESPVPTNAATQIETISDEKLVTLFPPGSCFLAEVNGQTVLIFNDQKLRDEVMR